MPYDDLGKALIIMGAAILVFGLLFLLLGRIPFMGRLPGDITFSRDGFTCIVPLASMLILSLLLTLILNIVLRLFNR
jgi:hypothetical protein